MGRFEGMLANQNCGSGEREGRAPLNDWLTFPQACPINFTLFYSKLIHHPPELDSVSLKKESLSPFESSK